MSKKIVNTVRKKLENGSTLASALKDIGISDTVWREHCAKAGYTPPARRKAKAKTYTPERVKEVQKRLNKGEFLTDITFSMNMDPRNLARYCRRNGIKLFSDTAYKKNLANRSKKRLRNNKEDITVRNLQALQQLAKGTKLEVVAKRNDKTTKDIQDLKKRYSKIYKEITSKIKKSTQKKTIKKPRKKAKTNNTNQKANKKTTKKQ